MLFNIPAEAYSKCYLKGSAKPRVSKGLDKTSVGHLHVHIFGR